MPFQSEKQRRFMFAKHPSIAKRWTQEAKAKGEPAVRPGASMQERLNAITTKARKR